MNNKKKCEKSRVMTLQTLISSKWEKDCTILNENMIIVVKQQVTKEKSPKKYKIKINIIPLPILHIMSK